MRLSLRLARLGLAASLPALALSAALLTLAAACDSPQPPRNYIVVTLDTVRADHLGAYGYKEGRTPYLDRQAAAGTVFEQAIAVAPLTMPAHASLFTGQYPFRHGVRNNGNFVLADSANTLAERFAAAGYDTGAVVSAMVVDSRYGLAQGFTTYDDDLYAGPKQKMFMFKELRADQTIDKALALATKTLREPFFLWVHLFDAHADYEPPPPFDAMFVKQPYDGELAFLDAELERFDKGLADAGRRDRTVLTITSDHGESLGEHGERTHGIFIYRATTHVPWLMFGPEIRAQRVPGIVSQVDLAPTLADLAGLPETDSDGVSLRKTLFSGRDVPSRDGAYSESVNPRVQFGWSELRALDRGHDKVIEAPRREYFDLTTDPHETRNLLAAPSGEGSAPSATPTASPTPKGATELFADLSTLTGADNLDNLILTPVDSQTREMLAALGYIGDAAGGKGGKREDPKDVAHRWDALQKCQNLARRNRDVEATECLQRIVHDDPNNWTARMSLTTVLQRQSRWAEAERSLNDALALDPNNLKTLASLAQVYQSSGRVELAVQTLRRATTHAGDDPEPWSQLGDILQSHGDPRVAIEAYGEALKRDALYVEAYIGVANTLHRTGDSERAVRHLEKAVGIDPHNLAAWYNLGVIRDRLGRAAAAQEAYGKALEIDPQHALTHNNLGSHYNRAGDRVRAERHFGLALQADPNHAEALYNLASLNLESRPDVALNLLQKAVTLKPDFMPARHNLGVLLTKQGKVKEGIAELEWVAAHSDQSPGTLITLASLYVGRGETKRAKDLLKKAVAQGGDRARQEIAKEPSLAKLGY